MSIGTKSLAAEYEAAKAQIEENDTHMQVKIITCTNTLYILHVHLLCCNQLAVLVLFACVLSLSS